MSAGQFKVVKARASSANPNETPEREPAAPPAAKRSGLCPAIVEKLTLPALVGHTPGDARLNDIHDRLSKLEREAQEQSTEPQPPPLGPMSVLRASITLAPVSGSAEPEIFRISVPAAQSPSGTVYSVWVESPTGPLGGFLSQIITSDAGSCVVAFTNLLTEPKEVRVCLGISQGN